MKKFSKIVLHVGSDKTGSTAIQSICDRNREILLQHGVHYPTGRWHAELGMCFCDAPEKYIYAREHYSSIVESTGVNLLKDKCQEYLNKLRTELNSTSANVVVFSYEGFWTLDINALKRFKNFIEEYSYAYEVVLYLRNPFSYAKSAMSQRVRTGRLSCPDGNPPLIPFRERLERLSYAFGKERLNLRKFSKDHLEKGDVVLDFLGLVGIPSEVADQLSNTACRENKALSAEAIFVGDKLVTALAGRLPRKDFYPLFGRLLEKIKGTKISLNDQQVDRISHYSKMHLDYLANNFGIYFKPETHNQERPDEPLAKQTLDSLGDIVVNLALKNIVFDCEIDFRKPEYPPFIAKVSGLSGPEPAGRWTDALLNPAVVLRFKGPLPENFNLKLSVEAFGPNAGSPVLVSAGNTRKSFLIEKANVPQDVKLSFKNIKNVNSIRILPPSPVKPTTLIPSSSDGREIGLRLKSLRITAE